MTDTHHLKIALKYFKSGERKPQNQYMCNDLGALGFLLCKIERIYSDYRYFYVYSKIQTNCNIEMSISNEEEVPFQTS